MHHDTCQRCFKDEGVGEHGVGLCPFEPRSSHHITRDEIPGGQVFENGFETPRKFYSHSEHRAALKAEGMQIVAKWAGPGDRHLKRWDVPSQKTLDDARVLLSRGRTEAEPAFVPDPISVRTIPGPWPEGITHG